MNESSTSSGQSSVEKHKTNAPVPPDDFVVDRIKVMKETIGGVKRGDNKWTEMLREKLDQDTVRTFKNNQQWVTPTPASTRDGPSKWSWFGVLFVLVPFDLLSEKRQRVSHCQRNTSIPLKI